MIKACFITKYPPIEGGVSKRGYWTAREMAERGNQIFVVTNANEVEDEFRMHMDEDDAEWYEPHFPETGGFVKVRRSQPVSNAMMHIPQSNPFVTKLSSVATQVVRKNGCEVIYADYLEPYGFAAYLTSQWTGVPYVVKHAGSDLGRLMKQRDLVTAYREILKAAACVWSGLGTEPFLAIGVKEENLWSNIESALPAIFSPETASLDLNEFLEKVARVQTDHVRNIVTNTKKIPMERPTIGIYGKVGEVKGSFDLVTALGMLKRRGLDFNFVALTQGRSMESFKEAIKAEGLEERTWLFPFIPHWRVPAFLRACTAICFLERDFPIAFHGPQIAKEVFACGACLILSGEIADKQPGSVRLTDGVNVLLVDDPKEHEDLARQLSVVIADPHRAQEIGLEGRKYYSASLARLRKRPRTYIERLEQKLMEVRDNGKAAGTRAPGDAEETERIRGGRLRKRLPGTSALLDGEWERALEQYLKKPCEWSDNQFKDAVGFCDFLKEEVGEARAGREYLADVLKYERTRNLLFTDLEREPLLRAEAPASERGIPARPPGVPRKTYEQIKLLKFVKGRGVQIEGFDYDLTSIMRRLRQGERPEVVSKGTTLLLFKKELNFVNLELEISEATRRLLDLCDGEHTVDEIVRSIAQEAGRESAADMDELKRDVLEIIRGLLVKGVIVPPIVTNGTATR